MRYKRPNRGPAWIICPFCQNDFHMVRLYKDMQPKNEAYFSCVKCNRNYIFCISDKTLWLLTKERIHDFIMENWRGE